MKGCKNNKWLMALCFAPILLFIPLKIFFPQFVYLTFLAFLICPISMGLMMYFMHKENKSGHNAKREGESQQLNSITDFAKNH